MKLYEIIEGIVILLYNKHLNIREEQLMSDSTSKTEYIVTYHTKGGGTYIETYDDYGVALFAAAAEMEANRDFRDWYEVKEVRTIEKVIKSTRPN